MKKSFFILILALALFASCEEEPQVLEAPSIPPSELYTVPIESITETDNDTTTTNMSTISYRNWAYAGVNLIVWNTAIVLNVGVPIAAFGAALNEDPIYLGGTKFEWSYVYRAPIATGGGVFDVVLTGEYITNFSEVEWVMNVSKRGGFQNFEWFRGVVSTDFRRSDFILNHQADNPEPLFSIDYDRVSGNSDHNIRYTNIQPNHSSNGAYIEFQQDSQSSFNRRFDVNAGPNQANNFLEIQWKAPSGEGRVKHEKHFNDTDWHCWDTRLRDTAC